MWDVYNPVVKLFDSANGVVYVSPKLIHAKIDGKISVSEHDDNLVSLFVGMSDAFVRKGTFTGETIH